MAQEKFEPTAPWNEEYMEIMERIAAALERRNEIGEAILYMEYGEVID
jgi:hypothetical protein